MVTDVEYLVTVMKTTQLNCYFALDKAMKANQNNKHFNG
jgi:hypothetical protein